MIVMIEFVSIPEPGEFYSNFNVIKPSLVNKDWPDTISVICPCYLNRGQSLQEERTITTDMVKVRKKTKCIEISLYEKEFTEIKETINYYLSSLVFFCDFIKKIDTAK